MSKRVTFAGAAASFFCGIVLSTIFVTDALINDKGLAARLFPWLHYPATENYAYRGFLGTVLITMTLFGVSRFTKPTDPAKLAQTTINWGGKMEPFQGLADWRLHLAGLAAVTVAAYWWMW
jgi:hypothetical protein